MTKKEVDRLAFGGMFLFLGIVFVYDGLLDVSLKKISVIIGIIFMGLGIIISKLPEFKKKSI